MGRSPPSPISEGSKNAEPPAGAAESPAIRHLARGRVIVAADLVFG
jgi:hypothetical protein